MSVPSGGFPGEAGKGAGVGAEVGVELALVKDTAGAYQVRQHKAAQVRLGGTPTVPRNGMLAEVKDHIIPSMRTADVEAGCDKASCRRPATNSAWR